MSSLQLQLHVVWAVSLITLITVASSSSAGATAGVGDRDWPTNTTPPFPPSWRTNDSTLLYWRNGTDYESNETLGNYGMIMFDWAHGAKVWINDYKPMDNGAVLAEQCRRLKLVNPHAKCIVYRNTVKALNQFSDISTLVDNTAYAGYFLPWKPHATQTGACAPGTTGGPPLMPNPQIECGNLTTTDVHVPMCDGADKTKCSKHLYFGTHQIPIVPGHNWARNTLFPFQNLSCAGGVCDCGMNPCGEYLFDFRNASLQRWFVETYMDAAMSPVYVDGILLDDSWGKGYNQGPSEEDKHCLDDMALSQQDVAALTTGWSTTRDALAKHATAKGAYIAPTYGGESLSQKVNSTSACNSRMRNFCHTSAPPTPPHYFSIAYEKVPPPTFGLKAVNMDLDMAFFLAVRGPYAWVGSGPILGWQLSHWWVEGQTRLVEPRDFRPHWFDVEFGEPLSHCVETVNTEPGVYIRHYTKATVTVDCQTLSGDIHML
eukprot:m.123759 g.123759  ORF g.123759 m.123759 type:complete len:487 (-) comp29011_c0_seq1:136-1596(-)